MKNLIIFALLVVGALHAWQRFAPKDPLPLEMAAPYVVVYGRDSCGYTTRMREALRGAGIPFDYRIVDQRDVADRLHQRMNQAGLETRRYGLPVVEVTGQMWERPDAVDVQQAYADSTTGR